jgi:hypothetical protein
MDGGERKGEWKEGKRIKESKQVSSFPFSNPFFYAIEQYYTV